MTANTTSDTTLVMKRTFNAPVEKVFDAWTKPDTIKKWMSPTGYSTPGAESDFKVGGKYRYTMRDPKGQDWSAIGVFKEISKPNKLVFTWTWENGPMPDTQITVELQSKGSGTEMTFTHDFFPTKDEKDKHNEGWIGCFDKLEKQFT